MLQYRNPYKEVTYCILEGEGLIEIGKTLRARIMVISFDERNNQVIQNQEQEENYNLMVELFTNPRVMKTSSFNGGKPFQKKTKEINKAIREAVGEGKFPGLYKIYDTNLQEYIGVQGLIDTSQCINGKQVVESLTFIKEGYLKKGYGRILIDTFFTIAQDKNMSLIYTVRSDNIGTKKICTGFIPNHIGVKIVANKVVDIFTIDYPLAQFLQSQKINIELLTTASRINSKNSKIETGGGCVTLARL